MTVSTEILIAGSVAIAVITLAARRQVVKIPVSYSLIFLAGILAAIGSRESAKKIRDSLRELPF